MSTTTSPFLELFAAYNPKREGRSFKMCCPFHGDDTPSLSVTPEKGLWRCFGCGEGGDAIAFLQRSQGLEFGEAADLWRQISGEEPKHARNVREGKRMGGDSNTNGTTGDGEVAPANKTEMKADAQANLAGCAENGQAVGQLLERMAELYAKGLARSEEAMAYLRERGITDMDTVRSFRLGYVDGSCAKLANTKAHREALIKLGILNRRSMAASWRRSSSVTARSPASSAGPVDCELRGRLIARWPVRSEASSTCRRPRALRTANWF